jgi:hypothetical protein
MRLMSEQARIAMSRRRAERLRRDAIALADGCARLIERRGVERDVVVHDAAAVVEAWRDLPALVEPQPSARPRQDELFE